MADPLDDGHVGPPWFGLFLGTVVDVADSLKLGRVRIACPEVSGSAPLPDWSYPLGTAGGGSKGRGVWAIPEVGAAVGVLFASGNENNSFYLPGWWGEPDDIGNEAPDPGGGGTKGDPKLVMWETEKWKVILDTPSDKLRIESKTTGAAFIEIEGATGNMVISTPDLKLGGTGALEALVLGSAFLTLFNAHTHSGVTSGGAASGPPVTPMVVGTHTSLQNKTL
jgi:phage baseplate assembly protein gpV